MILLGTVAGNGTISASAIEGFEELTAEDFFMVPSAISAYSGYGSEGNGNVSCNPTLTYDSTNGTIKVSGAYKDRKSSSGTVLLYTKLSVNIYYIE